MINDGNMLMIELIPKLLIIITIIAFPHVHKNVYKNEGYKLKNQI